MAARLALLLNVCATLSTCLRCLFGSVCLSICRRRSLFANLSYSVCPIRRSSAAAAGKFIRAVVAVHRYGCFLTAEPMLLNVINKSENAQA